MIDTHAHLHFPDFAGDRPGVLTRAFALGITGIVEVATGPAGWPEVLALANADPRIHASLGLHPHEARLLRREVLDELDRRLTDERVVAVGETGLDRVRGRAPLEDQRRAFIGQIGLARDRCLPLVIHCREAFPELFSILDREGRGVRGVFHCFSGGVEEARGVTGRGFRVGLGGAVTYAPERWRPVLGALPREAIMLETDAPYLRPDPERRRRNEPACLFTTADLVARLLELGPAQLEALADQNARDLFGIGPAREGRREREERGAPAWGGGDQAPSSRDGRTRGGTSPEERGA